MSVATIVDTDALLQTIVSALVAGLGVTLVFSLAILGAARFSDYSREGRTLAAAFAGTLAVAALLTTVAAIVVGVIVMSSK